MLCAALMIASVYLSLVSFVGTSPAEQTLSSIGREDPTWFAAWGIFTAAAVYLNVRLLADNLNFQNKLFNFMAALGSFSVIVTVVIWGDAWYEVAVHWTSGMVFGILSFFSVFVLLCVMSFRRGRMSPWIPIVAVAAAADVFTIIMLGLTALCEIVILVAVEVALFAVNFLQKEKQVIAATTAAAATTAFTSENMLQTGENIVELNNERIY